MDIIASMSEKVNKFLNKGKVLSLKDLQGKLFHRFNQPRCMVRNCILISYFLVNSGDQAGAVYVKLANCHLKVSV